MYNQTVILRGDGNNKIGLGHVYRLLALAEILRTEFECVFVIQDPDNTIIERIKDTCHEIRTLKSDDPVCFMKFLNGKETVILDGYQFTTSYQQNIKQNGSKLVCIDDLHDRHFVADAIINHAMGVKPAQYSAEPYTKFYLGKDYILLRKEFGSVANSKKFFECAEKIFICLGGTDPYNLTKQALESSAIISGVKEIHIVTSQANIYLESLYETMKIINDQGKCKVFIYSELNAAKLINVINHTDVAIVSSSNISYEVLSLNKMVICGWYVQNQKDLYDGICQLRNVIGLGDLKYQLSDKIHNAFELLLSRKYLKMVITSPFNNPEKKILEIFNKLHTT